MLLMFSETIQKVFKTFTVMCMLIQRQGFHGFLYLIHFLLICSHSSVHFYEVLTSVEHKTSKEGR